MKVSVLLASFEASGVETTMLRLANGLRMRGVDVDVVVLDGSRPGVRHLLRADIRSVDLQSPRLWTGLPALVRYLRRESPRAIIAAAPLANGLAGMAKLISRTTAVTILTEHGLRLFGFADGARIGRKLLKFALSVGYRQADALVGVSRGVAMELATRFSWPGAPPIKTIYNPVWSDELESAADVDPRHPWLGEGRVPVVIAVGRLAAEKGLDVLLEAMSLVTKQRASRLIVLGEGDSRSFLERRVRELGLTDVVDMPGFTNNPQCFIKAASVLVLSSWSEALPTVIIEALACGTPVVSTDCPTGPREILQDGKYGTLVPVGDTVALADGIVHALSTDADKACLMRRAREFSVDLAATRYLNLIELLGHRE